MKKPSSNDQQNDTQHGNTQIENEILRLKLIAELGAEANFIGGIPAEIENLFMKNVLEFEHGRADGKQITLYELLGKPAYKLTDTLDDEETEQALQEITEFLLQKHIVIEYSGTYDSRTKYKFITEELFEHETNDFFMPGMTMHYYYEEFHPNHKLDIESRTIEFLSQWFDRTLNEKCWALSDTFIVPDGRSFSKTELISKVKNLFDCYSSFTDYEYSISDINFELKNDIGMGYAEGHIKYNAFSEDLGLIPFKGPFKFYLSMDCDWWNIFYFILPGFEF